MTTPQAGDIGLTVITGPVGAFVRVGQWVAGDAAPVQHAFLVVDDQGATIEAMPGREGVRRNHVERYNQASTHYLRVLGMDDGDRHEVARQGVALLRRRYSYMQYPALGLLAVSEQAARLLSRPRRELRPAWLTRYIADSNRLICSQAVDLAFVNARHVRSTVPRLFIDGRAPGDLTPGDLWAHMTAPHAVFGL